jgi:PAS domain S-box-containing protein
MPEKPETYSFPLGAEEQCPAGTFVLDTATGRCDWSDGVYAIHGYTRGEVVPTIDLMMAHNHPEDREPIRHMLQDLISDGGQGALFHRLRDSKGREHMVLALAQADADVDEQATAVSGFMVDLTRPVSVETRRAAAVAVAGAYANRAVIEQAKGVIMGRLEIGAEEAFGILATRSQHTNTKVSTVATELVTAAAKGTLTSSLRLWDFTRAGGGGPRGG